MSFSSELPSHNYYDMYYNNIEQQQQHYNPLINMLLHKKREKQKNLNCQFLSSQEIFDRIVSHPDDVGITEEDPQLKFQWFSVLHFVLFQGFCNSEDMDVDVESTVWRNICLDLDIVRKVIEIESRRLKVLRTGDHVICASSALMMKDPVHGCTPLHIACSLPNCNPVVIQLLFEASPEVSKWPYPCNRLPFSFSENLRNRAERSSEQHLVVLFPTTAYIMVSKCIVFSVMSKFASYFPAPFHPKLNLCFHPKLNLCDPFDLLQMMCERLRHLSKKNVKSNSKKRFEELVKSICLVLKIRTQYLRPDYNYHDPVTNAFLPMHAALSHASNFMIACSTDLIHFLICKDTITKQDSDGNNPLHILTDISSHSFENISKNDLASYVTQVCRKCCKKFPICAVTRNKEGQTPFHTAIVNNSSCIVGILKSYKNLKILMTRDLKMRMKPFMLAAMMTRIPLSAVFFLLQTCPEAAAGLIPKTKEIKHQLSEYEKKLEKQLNDTQAHSLEIRKKYLRDIIELKIKVKGLEEELQIERTTKITRKRRRDEQSEWLGNSDNDVCDIIDL